MAEPLRHRQTKEADNRYVRPTTTAPHLDSTIRTLRRHGPREPNRTLSARKPDRLWAPKKHASARKKPRLWGRGLGVDADEDSTVNSENCSNCGS